MRHQPIADSHQHILLEGGVGAQVVFEDPDTDAADQVDRQNHHKPSRALNIRNGKCGIPGTTASTNIIPVAV